jgi:hypothetical protein
MKKKMVGKRPGYGEKRYAERDARYLDWNVREREGEGGEGGEGRREREREETVAPDPPMRNCTAEENSSSPPDNAIYSESEKKATSPFYVFLFLPFLNRIRFFPG